MQLQAQTQHQQAKQYFLIYCYLFMLVGVAVIASGYKMW